MHSLKSCDRARPELHLRWSALLHDIGKKEMKQVVDGRTVFYRHEEASARDADAHSREAALSSRELRKRVVAPRRAPYVQHHRRLVGRGGEEFHRARGSRESRRPSRASGSGRAIPRRRRASSPRMPRYGRRFDRVLASEAAFKIKDLAIGGGRGHAARSASGRARRWGRSFRELFETVLENPEENTRREAHLARFEIERKRMRVSAIGVRGTSRSGFEGCAPRIPGYQITY